MKIVFMYFLSLSLLIVACRPDPVRVGNEFSEILKPTILNLEMDKHLYHQSNIELTGYFNYSFENVALYINGQSESNKAIWIDFSDTLSQSLSEDILMNLQGREIRVQGNYDATKRGHLGAYIGTIELAFIESVN